MGVDCHSRIVIIAQGELSRQSHVIKPAKSLRDAGFEVVRLGFKWAHGEMRKEEDGIGRIFRLDRDAGPAIGVPGTPAQASTGDPEVGTKRHWAIEVLKTALFRFRTGRRIRKWVVVGRVLSSMKRDTRALVRAGRSLDPDLVICIQLDMLPAGVALARECGVPLLYDVRDLSCDSGWSHHDDPRFRRIERKLIRKADLVSAASPEMSADLASMYGRPLPIVL
jgi:hypothetical protein